MPDAILIAGCNGAGKTTFARQFLPLAYSQALFLNTDEIQTESFQFQNAVASGRELLRRLSVCEESRSDFAIETTLSSEMYAKRIPIWKSYGYVVHLHFLELTSADLAVERVARRVALGGHPVPENDIRRRYERGIRLFHQVYKSLVNFWYHWKSTDQGVQFEQCNERP